MSGWVVSGSKGRVGGRQDVHSGNNCALDSSKMGIRESEVNWYVKEAKECGQECWQRKTVKKRVVRSDSV